MVLTALLAAQLVWPLSARQIGRIDRAAAIVMRAQHVPGLSLGIERDGSILYARGYGMRDASLHLAADERSVYAIGSISKQFTAAAVRRLAARGRLSLDAPLREYVPGYTAAANVTVRELLEQTSGIPSYDEQPQFDRYAERAYTPQQLVAYVENLPLAFAPGTRFAYSNTNYVLLGQIVERASGEAYDRYVQSELLAPLGLAHTTYGLPQAGDVATGYTWKDGAQAPVPPQDPSALFAAGAYASNVPDLLAWCAALVRDGTVLQDDPAQAYGDGFYFARIDGRPVAYEPGYVNGFSSLDLVDLRTGLALVILANAQSVDLVPLSIDLLRAAEPL